MKRIIICCSYVTITCFIGGCAHPKFTVISDKLVRLSEFEMGKADKAKDVEGKQVRHVIIFVPIGEPPTLRGALDDALEKGGGDVMTDAVVSTWGWYIPYIYGQVGMKVKGDVVKTRKK